jgi:hypothetical protein
MNIERGKKRLLIGIPFLSIYAAFFGGVSFWPNYETFDLVWGVGVLFGIFFLLGWSFFHMLRWIVKGFDLRDDHWMSLREIENKRYRLLCALQEIDITVMRAKLRAIAEGNDSVEEDDLNDYQVPKHDDWWHKNFDVRDPTDANYLAKKTACEYKLYTFITLLVFFGAGAIIGLIILLIGPPTGP